MSAGTGPTDIRSLLALSYKTSHSPGVSNKTRLAVELCATLDCETDHAKASVVSIELASARLDGTPDETAMRLHVMEMTVAVIAARLPKADLEEVASLLVFVAKCADGATDLTNLQPNQPNLSLAGHYATEMLERISKVRRSSRSSGSRH